MATYIIIYDKMLKGRSGGGGIF